MAARSIWNGALAFGEVVVPVKLFSAVEDHAVHFHEVRLRDGCPIKHRRMGVESGKEVPAERIAKAYETSRGHQVVLEEQEIAAARGSRPKVIDIEHFVQADQIDPIFYDHPYILGAQPGGEHAYRVLQSAVARTDLVGIGRFVLRTREQLVGLRSRGRALMLYTMRFADEIVDASELDSPALRRKPSPQELTMAKRLIDTLAGDWQHVHHKDRYRQAVLEVIERKAAGETIQAPAAEPVPPPDDLMALLQQSLSEDRTRRPGRGHGHGTAAKAQKAKTKTKAKAKTKAAR